MTRLFPPIFFLIFSAAVSLAGAANLLDGSAASERRMELLKLKFEKALKKARCPYGVLCVATADGKVYAEPVGIPAEGAEIKKRAQQKSLPLGESSFACVTFAAVKMEEAGKLGFFAAEGNGKTFHVFRYALYEGGHRQRESAAVPRRRLARAL